MAIALKSYYIPSIMTNKNLDLVIGAIISGENDFTNVAFASRKKKEPLGTLRSPMSLTNNTGNSYPNNGSIGQRWGDESSLCSHPSNDLDIWSTGEWVAIENGGGVQTTQLKGCKK